MKKTNVNPLDFASLSDIPRSKLLPFQKYQSRSGAHLPFREYLSKTPKRRLILVHGSGYHGAYLHFLAEHLAQTGTHVYLPDLRGHGESPERRGDVDYIGQLQDDLHDLVKEQRKKDRLPIILGGHSSGGGLAARFGGTDYRHDVDGYLFVAPYLGHDAPTTRPDSGGWAKVKPIRLIAASILSQKGFKPVERARVLKFSFPKERRDGHETMHYSYRMMVSFNPRNYQEDLKGIKKPALTIVGTDDQALFAEKFEPTLKPLGIPVQFIEEAGHLGITQDPRLFETVEQWLNQFE